MTVPIISPNYMSLYSLVLLVKANFYSKLKNNTVQYYSPALSMADNQRVNNVPVPLP